MLFDFVVGGLGCSCCLRLFPTILRLYLFVFGCLQLFQVVLCRSKEVSVFGGL